MAFTAPTYDVDNIQGLADLTQNQATAIKVLFDKTGADTKTYLIALLAELAKTTDGSSGADNLGMTAITETGAAATVQSIIEALITRLKATTDSASGADLIGATTIVGLTGNDVQTLLEALHTIKAPLASPSFTGAPTVAAGTDYTTAKLRNAILSTADPTSEDGGNGDIWIKYTS